MGIFVSRGFKLLKYNACNVKFGQGRNVTTAESLSWVQEVQFPFSSDCVEDPVMHLNADVFKCHSSSIKWPSLLS